MNPSQTLYNFLKENLSHKKKILFIGLGNTDRADDGFGIIIARELKKSFPEFTYNELDDDIEELFLEVVNNQLSVDYIVYIDAVDVNKSPGELVFLNLNSKKLAQSISTHSSLISIYISLLRKKCEGQYLLGVQPLILEPYQKISDTVLRGINNVRTLLERVLNEINFV